MIHGEFMKRSYIFVKLIPVQEMLDGNDGSFITHKFFIIIAPAVMSGHSSVYRNSQDCADGHEIFCFFSSISFDFWEKKKYNNCKRVASERKSSSLRLVFSFVIIE